MDYPAIRSWSQWANERFPLHAASEQATTLVPVECILEQRPFAIRERDDQGPQPSRHRANVTIALTACPR